MCADRRARTTRPQDDNRDDRCTPCPSRGCRRHTENVVAVSLEAHATHHGLRCGRWFDERETACPRCGSPGEWIGVVDAAERGLYTQYRCCECSHGFMVRAGGGEDVCRP